MNNNLSDASSVRKAKSLKISPLFLWLILVAVFATGVLLGTHRHKIMATVLPMFSIAASSDELDVTALQEAYRQLDANFDGEIDKKELSEGAIRGMLEAAGDEYTTYFNQQEAAEFESEMKGSIGGGVGAQVGLRDDQVTFVKIINDTPAERAGLMAGDRVVAINDQSTEGMNVEQAVERIRGEIGTTVKLEVVRAGEKMEFSITRDEISAPSTSFEVKDGVGVITLTRFDQESASAVRRAAQQLKDQGVKGMVLDLRANPGGYLDAARDISGVWLNNKVAVIEKVGNEVKSVLKTKNAAILDSMPTVVLIDAGSASASEIVAGALQDHEAATIMGEKSFGKGSVQRLVPLDSGALLKVTVARWYTPDGRNITKEGIMPDIEVKLSEEQMRAGDDAQLKAAIEHLGK